MKEMLRSTDSLDLYTNNYLVQNARAAVLIIHGLGEYADRYLHVAAVMNAERINVYTFDLRGHGHSAGTRALIRDIAEYRDDVEAVYATVPKDMPLFLLGHSMGGLVAVDFLQTEKRPGVRGVILSGAALEVGADITSFTQTLVRFLAKISPKIKTVTLDFDKISRDPKTVEDYKNDPLIYREGGKAGLAVALLDAIETQKQQYRKFNYPVLIMHGGDDTITNPEGSKKLFEQAISDDKTLKIWEGAYHEIYNEVNRKEVIDFTLSWILSRI